MANYVLSAESLATAASHLALSVGAAFLVALEEVRAFVLVTAPRQAFEAVVAVVVLGFLPMKANTRVHARVSAAAEGSVYAVIVLLAEFRLICRSFLRLLL